MDPSDIGGSPAHIGGPTIVTTETFNGTSAPAKIGFSNKDSLSASEIEAALSMMWTIYAQNPTLPPPVEFNKLSSIDGGILGLSAQYHKIIMNVLDSWSENIKKIAATSAEIEKGPQHQLKIEHERKLRLGIVDGVKNYADQVKSSREDGLLGSLASALVLTGAFIGSVTVVDVSSTLMVGVTPQIDAVVGFANHALSPLSETFAAQLGLIGAWAMGTMISYTTLESVVDKQSGKTVDEKTLAEKYAGKALRMIVSPEFERFISGMLEPRTEKGEPLSEERQNQLAAVLKMVLLSSALAAVYMSKTEHITGDEFLALAKGTMKPEKGVETELVNAIKDLLDAMLPSEKVKILDALASYMDTHPKFSSFLNVGKTFDSVNEELTLPPDAVKT